MFGFLPEEKSSTILSAPTAFKVRPVVWQFVSINLISLGCQNPKTLANRGCKWY